MTMKPQGPTPLMQKKPASDSITLLKTV